MVGESVAGVSLKRRGKKKKGRTGMKKTKIQGDRRAAKARRLKKSTQRCVGANHGFKVVVMERKGGKKDLGSQAPSCLRIIGRGGEKGTIAGTSATN